MAFFLRFNKQKLLDWAELTDAWRVVPRALLAAYCVFTARTVDYVLSWYTALPAAERNLETAGLTGTVIATVTGLATWVTKFYLDSGRDWSKPPIVITPPAPPTVTTTTTTSAP